MPKKKTDAKNGQKAVDFRFKIDAFTPETMPMARLSEYLAQLAAILGEPNAVHLIRLEAGSTVLVHKIEREAIPKVRERAIAVRRGEAPRDALAAYKTVNKLLREDNGMAVLQEKKRGPVILTFPGIQEAVEDFPSVREHGSIDGYVMRVGGMDETVHVLLQSEGEPIAGCYTTRLIAKQLAQRLFEPARLFGKGRWGRDREGNWTLETFKIESFEWLQANPLSVAVTKLRAIGGDWGKGAYDELKTIRHGTADGDS